MATTTVSTSPAMIVKFRFSNILDIPCSLFCFHCVQSVNLASARVKCLTSALARPTSCDMAILPIIETPDPRLKVKSLPVAAVDDTLRQLMDDMLETMYDAPGIGLAAIQVGEAKRVLVIDLQDNEIKAPRYFVNPEILWVSDALSCYNEGCLSVPDQYAEVERPVQLRLAYLDYHGVAHEDEIDGLLATCVQHEMDHLEGILFIDRLSKLKRDMLLRKLQKSRRQSA
jgi:peptide deformylase